MLCKYKASWCVLVLTGLVAGSSLHAENWPQWRGPANNGISGETSLPVKWSETEGVLWKLDLPGPAASTPVIWGDQIFFTSAAENDLVLICVSTSGKPLWKQTLGSGDAGARGDEGNAASPSPCTDGKRVWAFVGSGDLACFTTAGKPVWKQNLQKTFGKFNIQFGMTSTPVLEDGRLYIQLIHSGEQKVACLDGRTGKTIWAVDRKSDGRAECEHSYASPVIWGEGKQAQLVTHGNDYTVGHQLKDGRELWRVGGLNPKNSYNTTLRFVASPVVAGSMLVIPTAKNGPVVALDPSKAAGMIEAGGGGEVWRMERNTPDVPSPLVHDGLVYLCRENGNLHCLDAQTGQEIYPPQRTHVQRYRASPVLADGRLYLTARDGTVSVVKAGKTFEIVSTNKVDDDLAASPVVSGGRIYLRGFKKLYAIGAK